MNDPKFLLRKPTITFLEHPITKRKHSLFYTFKTTVIQSKSTQYLN